MTTAPNPFTAQLLQNAVAAAVATLRRSFPNAMVAVVAVLPAEPECCACSDGNLSSPQLLQVLAQQWAIEQRTNAAARQVKP